MVENRVTTITPRILALGVFSLFLLAGCQQTANDQGRFVSPQGVKIESMWPADTFLLIKVGTQDEGQIANLKTLNSYFPNDPMGALVDEFNVGFKQGANLDEMGLDYEKDILPILNEKSEMYLAVAPGKALSTETTSDSTEVKAVLAMTLADQGKFDGLLQRQVEKGKLKQDSYNGQNYFTETDLADLPAYIFRYNDLAVVTTSLESLKAGVDNERAGKNPLADNSVYQQTVNKYYKPSIALIYGDFSKVVDFMSETSSDGKDLVQSLNSLNGGTNVTDIAAEIVLVSAEKDGIRLSGDVVGKTGVDLNKSVGGVDKVYLADKIPAQDAVVYIEGNNLQAAYTRFLEIGKNNPDFDDNMKEMRDYLHSQDLDLEKDVLPILDKGFAMILEDNSSVLPTIGFYLDASSNPDSAAKVAAKINDGFDQLFTLAKKDSPDLELLMTKEEVTPAKLWKFKLNIDPLLIQMPPVISKKMSGQKIEFYYGLLPDNVMVFALTPDLEKNYGQAHSVSKGQEYQKAMSYLNDAKGSIGYVAPGQIAVYADRLMQLAKDSGALPGTPEPYQLIKSYVSPIKSLVFGTNSIEKNHLHSEAFLHIANN